MTQDLEAWTDVEGADQLERWFGAIPSFHDAGVEALTLSAGDGATLRLRAFRMTDEVDDRGYFVLDKHAHVTFRLTGLTVVELDDFDTGSVLRQLQIVRVGERFELIFDSHVGVSGRLQAQSIGLEVQPVLATV